MYQTKTNNRPVDLVVISDVHLGTYGCHASELVTYLRGIKPGVLVLNGDIIDGWAFSKRYFPASHHQVLMEVMRLLSKGTKVYYLTGNHDEMLRRFSDLELGDFHLADKLVLEIDGKKAWIFHGDIFDLSVNTGKWLAKIAGKSYDYLILLNRAVNFVLEKMGKEKVSISRKIKAGVKQAVKFVGDFEEIAAKHAVEQNYDYVICGHIHQPQQRKITIGNKSVTYLNSGDWIENLSALEYHQGQWSIYKYEDEIKTLLNQVNIETGPEKELIFQKKASVEKETISLTLNTLL
jgi:UDP-2,3-diacylglucosamine pyrophosphatase LpxH